MSFIGDVGAGIGSTVNSTTTPLSGAATFTGTSELNEYPDVMVSCFTDAPGTLYFDFSINGTDWRTFPSSGFAVSANIHEFHTAVKGPRYFRVRLVNGSGAQSLLQLQTYYGQFRAPSAPLNQTQGRDADATMVRPSLAQDEISIGLKGGVTQFNKFGYRSDVDTGGEKLIIANNVTDTLVHLTTASTFTVAYNNTTDGLGTTGALNLYFYYLDTNGEAQIGVHTLGNTGSDVTSFSGLVINRIALGLSGSAGVNTNDITITATTGGSVQGFIPANDGTSQQCWYGVPSNAKALAKSLFVNVRKLSGGGAPRVTIIGWVYNRGIQTKYQVFRYDIDTGVENTMTFTDACNFPLNATDVLYFTATTDTNNTSVNLRFSLNVYNNA